MIEPTDIGALDSLNAGDRWAFVPVAAIQMLTGPNRRIVNALDWLQSGVLLDHPGTPSVAQGEDKIGGQ
jgi:hypothetical protein